MSRYISVDDMRGIFCQSKSLTQAWSGFDMAPSIDIVRCKECKWAKPNREGDYDCKCHIPTFRIKADDFCSCGERESE